jgi:hypothetical protein
VAARSVAEALVTLALSPPPPVSGSAPILEIAGLKPENLVDMAVKLAARRGSPHRVKAVGNTGDPDQALYEPGGLLPGPMQDSQAQPSRNGWSQRHTTKVRSPVQIAALAARLLSPTDRAAILYSGRLWVLLRVLEFRCGLDSRRG